MTRQISNLRVRRTQKLLREALIELIEERGFEALTIGEITERAMVSRAAGSVAKNLEGGDGREGFFLASFTLPLETGCRYMQLDR